MYRYVGLNASEERWVVFIGPGSKIYNPKPLYAEVSPRKILELAPDSSVIAFYITTVVVMTARHCETGEEVILRSNMKPSSGFYFIDGVLYDQTRLRKESRDSGHMRSSLMVEGLKFVVKTRDGGYMPFNQGHDQIIPA